KVSPNMDCIDLVGGKSFLEILKDFTSLLETVITVPTYSAQEIANFCSDQSINYGHFIVKSSSEDIKECLSLFDSFNLPESFFCEYKLSEASQMHQDYETGKKKGKLFINFCSVR